MSIPLLTERCSEKYGKKLIGRTDLEDALKRLDKLTHEEARMATAEVLRMTHAIDETVTEVREQVVVVDDRVASVDTRVASVDNRMASVDNRVASVDDKVAEVINGMQIMFTQTRESANFKPFRWKGNEASHQTNGQRCRSSETFVISSFFVAEVDGSL